MLYFLNRPLILEHVIVKAFDDYFKALRTQEYYRNWSIHVTNEHPFSLMIPDFTYNASIFPCVVVSTESDEKPSELMNLVESSFFILEKTDIPLLEEEGYVLCDELKKDLENEFAKKEKLCGVSRVIRRQERISIEIWSENIQLKNELYEMCRLFLAGGIKDALAEYRKKNNVVIFDNTIQGDRSGNFNYDFGVKLAGSRLSFNADYFIEQSIIDTKIDGNKNIIWEVIDNVKGSK
ncbi:hypothetical protein [Treponema phagedenis]|uniref:Uncharacterized protein n=1 Tax=Treponema phagedenis TaxID=162 RepID=A0AAE6M8C2_TREPH|nr:hypothetical protein [Treponema phagedenis]QEJ95810.1 hypothetical protein FUT79_11790 [Treponema phagedenis]QEJ97382.1 hypothetical protein FUT82_04805 [Treponema phagedenis]QEK04155.1 hypothetical protein FUT83_10280 [Treponema phagedenis]QEK09771.1 hypothetical protein FUT81_10200 [Treponema phagedenis]